MRMWLGTTLIKLGFAIIPADVREMARGIMMYHVPGALSEEQKAEIRAAKWAAER